MTDTAEAIRILVCGDIRLDAPFAYHNADMAQKRRAEARATLSALMDKAEESGVRYVLFCGNLLDAQFATGDTAAFFIEALKKHEGLTFVIAPGDADRDLIKPLYATSRMPENVYVFTDEKPTRFDFDDVTFYGFAASTGENALSPAETLTGLCSADDDKLHVLAFTGKADVESLRAARSFRADVTAIGDFSVTAHAVYGESPLVFSPGCAEGRDFTTPGFGGSVTVVAEKTAAGYSTSASFSRYSARRYILRELSVEGCKTPGDIRKAIKNAVRDGAYGDDTFLRFILTGAVPPELLVPQISESLGLYGLRLTDATIPTEGAEYLLRDMSVRGELYRSMESAFHREDTEDRRMVAEAFRLGLAELDDRERE